MADVFNKNPTDFIDMNNLFPVLNDKVGLTYEQWRIAMENINYVYNKTKNGTGGSMDTTGLEKTVNKTNVIDENSTEEQYPSAKAVYNAINGALEESY